MFDILKAPHTNLDELSRIQEEVAERVKKENEFKEINTVAGCDISFSEEDRAYAACVSLDYQNLEKIESSVVGVEVNFPYIPTYLAFRELKPMLKAIKGVDSDVYMIDSQGLAHPRRAGLASHLGVIIDEPTIGVAKSKLCGEAETPGSKKGSHSPLKENGETIGAAVRTRTDVNPVYVSVGHKVTLDKAIEITLQTSPQYKIPEPIRAAHKLATEKMKNE